MGDRADITDADVAMVLAVDRVRHGGSNDGCDPQGVRRALEQGFWPIDEYRAIAALARQREDSGLTFRQLRAANEARCHRWHPQGITSWSPSDWLTAVTGELGELASLLKMRNRERDGLVGNKFSPTDQQIADELADVLTYLDLLAAALRVDLGQAVTDKFNAVSARNGFPDHLPSRAAEDA